jgi:hypothetical protein
MGKFNVRRRTECLKIQDTRSVAVTTTGACRGCVTPTFWEADTGRMTSSPFKRRKTDSPPSESVSSWYPCSMCQIKSCLREFRQNCPSLLFRHNATSQQQGEVYAPSSGGPAAPARSCGLIFSALNLPARSRMVFSTSSSGGGSPLIQRNGLIRATTNDRK